MLHFIINPAAGRTGCEKLYGRIEPILRARNIEPIVTVCKSVGGITPLAQSAVDSGAAGVVVMGGDGTVVEAARALANTGIPLGIIPGGTGNDLATTLGIPREPEKALEAVLQGKTRAMDAGSLNGLLFVNVAGTGFDVLVTKNVSKFKRVLTGLAGYGAAVFYSILKSKPKHVVLETQDGIIERDILLVAIANGRYYGGGMKVAPDADPFDGLFDICIIDAVPRWKIPTLLSKFVKGKHLALDICEYFKTPWINLRCEEETTFNLDGEIAGEAPAKITLLPGALQVYVP